MKHSRALLALLLGSSLLPAQAYEADKPKASGTLPYAWPFLEAEEMAYRGGTTKGSEVTLDESPAPAWKTLQESDGSGVDKDRLAILAMAGQFRVSFQFVETMGFTADYAPPRPYFSWGTEEVRVLEEREDFISLQHTLVMFFEGEDGKVEGPMVMKHWRQDWSYEDADLHTFRGDRSWERETRPAESVKGTWTQAVYQVDDSPRYEVVGRWDHDGGVSTWTSDSCWRPLPRREFSVRDDYNVLDGIHRITLTPTGWVHNQDNRKLLVKDGQAPQCLAIETGINRYERITAPDLASGSDEYWNRTGAYWKEVREAWADVFRNQDRFALKAEAEDKKLFQHHFGFAAEIGEAGSYDAEAGRRHAQGTIRKFLGK